jgi:hypothetical protein
MCEFRGNGAVSDFNFLSYKESLPSVFLSSIHLIQFLETVVRHQSNSAIKYKNSSIFMSLIVIMIILF